MRIGMVGENRLLEIAHSGGSMSARRPPQTRVGNAMERRRCDPVSALPFHLPHSSWMAHPKNLPFGSVQTMTTSQLECPSTPLSLLVLMESRIAQYPPLHERVYLLNSKAHLALTPSDGDAGKFTSRCASSSSSLPLPSLLSLSSPLLCNFSGLIVLFSWLR
jgi:hypothetical protein